jgi:hypothetical protein
MAQNERKLMFKTTLGFFSSFQFVKSMQNQCTLIIYITGHWSWLVVLLPSYSPCSVQLIAGAVYQVLLIVHTYIYYITLYSMRRSSGFITSCFTLVMMLILLLHQLVTLIHQIRFSILQYRLQLTVLKISYIWCACHRPEARSTTPDLFREQTTAIAGGSGRSDMSLEEEIEQPGSVVFSSAH